MNTIDQQQYEKFLIQRKKQNESMKKVMKNYYRRNFMILETDDVNTRKEKTEKISARKEKLKNRYTGEQAEKQRIRMREYRAKKKAEKIALEKQEQEQKKIMVENNVNIDFT